MKVRPPDGIYRHQMSPLNSPNILSILISIVYGEELEWGYTFASKKRYYVVHTTVSRNTSVPRADELIKDTVVVPSAGYYGLRNCASHVIPSANRPAGVHVAPSIVRHYIFLIELRYRYFTKSQWVRSDVGMGQQQHEVCRTSPTDLKHSFPAHEQRPTARRPLRESQCQQATDHRSHSSKHHRPPVSNARTRRGRKGRLLSK